jgi:hypothetical protein
VFADYHAYYKLITEIRSFLKPEEFTVTNIKQGNRNQNILYYVSQLLAIGER